jgi:hypothetical protein
MTMPVVVDGLPDKKLWNVRAVLTARDHQSDVPEVWFFAALVFGRNAPLPISCVSNYQGRGMEEPLKPE